MKNFLRTSLFVVMILAGYALGSGWLLMAEDKPDVKSAEKTAEKTAEKATESAEKSVAAEENKSEPDSNSGDGGLVAELKRRSQALEARARDLDAKEKELKSLEVALNDQMKKLQELRDEYGKLTEAQKKEREEKLGRFVETVEGMSPKSAAQVLGNVEERLAIEAMNKLSTQKLSKVMQSMDPKRSAKLMESYTGYKNRLSDNSPVAIPDVKPETRAPSSVPATGGKK